MSLIWGVLILDDSAAEEGGTGVGFRVLGDILGVSKRLTLLGGKVDFDGVDGVVVVGEGEGVFCL